MTNVPVRKLSYVPISSISRDPRNPRRHGRAQIQALARSIETFGFNAPVLVDKQSQLIAGHGRLEAGKLLGLTHIPAICLDDLTETQARAYMLADNKLNERSAWDDEQLAICLKELSEIVLDFDIEALGFEAPEIDFRIQSLDEAEKLDDTDTFTIATKPAVSRLDDIWCLGDHRIYCGNALDAASYEALLGGERAGGMFTDPPYNVRISGHVSGLGEIRHREFLMASGEMTIQEFTAFLTTIFGRCRAHLLQGATIYACIDWRHVGEMLSAGNANDLDLLNICVWVKTNGGMGSFYRSRHELVFVFRNGKSPHLNNVQLGRHGRNRTNVWNYAGANVFSRKGKRKLLEAHPTVKPIRLVADALLDSTARGDIVIDPFLGSGTTLLAAERTGRMARGIELDPQYVDTTILRWQKMTKEKARHIDGRLFDAIRAERNAEA